MEDVRATLEQNDLANEIQDSVDKVDFMLEPELGDAADTINLSTQKIETSGTDTNFFRKSNSDIARLLAISKLNKNSKPFFSKLMTVLLYTGVSETSTFPLRPC